MEEGGGKAGKALDRELAIVSSVCLKSCGSTARVTCCGEVHYGGSHSVVCSQAPLAA